MVLLPLSSAAERKKKRIKANDKLINFKCDLWLNIWDLGVQYVDNYGSESDDQNIIICKICFLSTSLIPKRNTRFQ